MTTNTELELGDIQGFIIRGYAKMGHARYCALSIQNPTEAKQWLTEISKFITTTIDKGGDTCLNLAFSIAGFRRLGLKKENLKNFSIEFRDGMASEHRSRMLGDLGESNPVNWAWGSENHPEVDILLMLFGNTQETLDTYYAEQKKWFENNGLSEIINLDGITLPENREHFGFRDGISQPVIKGSGRSGPDFNLIEPGEFILGYNNEYGVYPESPLIEIPQGDENLLPEDANGTGLKDLGRNGSYLVFRQLQQHVDKFWDFMIEKGGSAEEATKLASKMMGRWPSGAPLVNFPDKDPGGNSDDDNFLYAKEDPTGAKCPFGSHLRRNNPRDHFEDNSPSTSLSLTKKHRIMRRARLYGEPIVGSALDHKPQSEVGLLFMSFQANIGMQFEFLQHTWANYPNFRNYYNDPDPIIGTMDKPYLGYEQNFTIQGDPVSKTVTGLKPFVRTRGGGYFFFPGIMAVRYLGSL